MIDGSAHYRQFPFSEGGSVSLITADYIDSVFQPRWPISLKSASKALIFSRISVKMTTWFSLLTRLVSIELEGPIVLAQGFQQNTIFMCLLGEKS